MDDFDDNASDLSLPGIGTSTFEMENNAHCYRDQERGLESVRIERRFSEKNRQIGEKIQNNLGTMLTTTATTVEQLFYYFRYFL